MRSSLILPAILLLISCSSCHEGVKTVRHAYSSSASGSNSFASSYASGGSGSFKVGVANDYSGNPAFWWVGPNSPFKEAYEYFRKCSLKGDCSNFGGQFIGVPANLPNNLPENGCNDQGCSFSGSFNINDKNSADFGPIDISKNPFLNGEFKGVSFSSCTGNACPGGKPHSTLTTTTCKGSDCKTNTQHGAAPSDLNLNNNPFFTGSFGSSGCSGTNGGCTGGFSGGSSSGSFGFSGTQGQIGIGSGCSGSACAPAGSYPGNQGQVGGCAGVKGGCGGSTSFGGVSGGTYSGQTGFSQNIPTNYPGQTSHISGSFSGSSSGSFSGNSQNSYSHTLSTSYPNQGPQSNQKQPHTSYPDQGSQTGQKQPHTSYPDQGTGYQPNYNQQGPSSAGTPQNYPKQPGYTGSGTVTSGGTTSFTSGSQHGQTGSTSGTYNQHGYTPSGGFPGSGPSTGIINPEGSINGQPTQKCYGDGLICVKKHLCNNGIVNTDGEGLLHIREGINYCNVNTEICCKLPNRSGQPHKDINLQIPTTVGGQTYFQGSSSHKASSSSSSASSSAASSTFFGSHTSPAIGTRYTPSPSNPTASGVQPGGYNPNLPGGLPNYSNYQPGQSIPFGGRDGQSPGVIQVIPDGQTGTKTLAPGLVRPTDTSTNTDGGLIHYSPGEAPGLKTTPGLSHYGPGSAPELKTTPDNSFINVYPNGVSSTLKPGSINYNHRDVTNDLSFASTIKGPAYLPPGPSPTPLPSSYTPDLLPPERSTPKPVYPSSPAPSTYYPTQKPTYPTTPAPSPYYPTQRPTFPTTKYYPTQKPTTGYLPPTKKPQVNNGYLPPDVPQVTSATAGNNQYLPPPRDKEEPDSNIINISVLPLNPTKKPTPDRDPQDTNTRNTFLRPTSQRPTDFLQNTTPYPGCAAALKCVQFDFCTADGTISPTRVILTKEQESNRVPLTECQDLETGLVGKCCRDPDYKDPWPSTQLGLFNPDQEFQGSNPGQYRQTGNDGKYRPQNEVKGGVKGRPQIPGGTRPYNPFEPNQIGAPSNTPNAVISGYPTNIPNVPFDSRQVNVPQQVNTKPSIENRYDQKYPTSQVKGPENCGVRNYNTQPAGPGPIDANFAEIPWQAMILRDTNRSLLCGGAIIRRDVVLTAAHCVENLLANDVLVKGGEWKLGIDEEPKPFQINKVEAIVRHPGYRPDNRLNDVALLILKDKFRLDKNVDTLCLPDPNEDIVQKYQNAKCITTGWGKTILQLNILNSIMHILGVGIISGGQCQQQLQQYHNNAAHLYNTNCVCGVPIQPQTDICDVDVGSALACEGPDGRYTLAGIYSWDTGCNPTAQVAGYTKVDSFWVQQTLQRPIQELKTEESGFYQQLQGQQCHCLPGQ